MKAFASICLFFFLAWVSVASVAFDEKDFNLQAKEIKEGHAKYVPSILFDGRRSIAVYNGDTLEGFIIEEHSGEASIWDADGHRIDPAEIIGDDDDHKTPNIERRQSRWTILRRFARFIASFPGRSFNFLVCISFRVALLCADEIIDCATYGGIQDVGDCLEAITCGAGGFGRCVREQFR